MRGLFVVLLAVSAAGAPARVTVESYPRVAMAPAALKLTARVDPHADNRLLRVTLDCELFYASSEFDLAGERAAKTYQLPLIEGIPPGLCEATAELTLVSGKSLRSRVVEVQIVGGEPRP